jgi:hypothetical protein
MHAFDEHCNVLLRPKTLCTQLAGFEPTVFFYFLEVEKRFPTKTMYNQGPILWSSFGRKVYGHFMQYWIKNFFSKNNIKKLSVKF